MINQSKIIKAGLTVALIVGATIFFGHVYPHHLHYQEQFQIFMFTGSYAAEVIMTPGGLADYLGRFFTQFFFSSGLGAILIGLLLAGIQLAMWGLMAERPLWAYPLSFIPSIALWMHLCDENSLMGATVAVLLSLLCALAARQIKNPMVQLVVMLITTPLMLWLCGALGVAYPLVLLARMKWHRAWSAIAWVCLTACVVAGTFAAQRYVHALPLGRVVSGIHYYRFPQIIAAWPWVAVLASAAIALVSRWLKPVAKGSKMRYAVLGALIVVIGGSGFAGVNRCSDMGKEELMAYDYWARTKQWSKIVDKALKKNPDVPMSVACLNLALAKTGQLADYMFLFYQNGSQGLLPTFVRDFTSPLATSEAYYHLGFLNTAQRFTFEAQEAIPDFQKSGRCYKRLAETSMLTGNKAVAQKYIKSLQHTLVYRNWANWAQEMLDNPDGLKDNPEYSWLSAAQSRGDFYYSEDEMDSMLGLLFQQSSTNKMAYEYLMAWCLLNKNLPRFEQCYPIGAGLGYDHIPMAYQEALALHWTRLGNPLETIPWVVSDQVCQRMAQFIADVQAQRPRSYMLNAYRGSYWAYYFFK